MKVAHIVLLALVVGVAAESRAQDAVVITSLAPTTVRPFGSLVINGSGFRPGDAEIAVLIKSGTSGALRAHVVPTAIPVHVATSTQVEVTLPPLVDANSAELTSGQVDVQVVQTTSSSLMTSNTLSGLTVSAVRPLPSGLRPGSVTRGYIRSALHVLEEARTAAAGRVETAQALAALHTSLTEFANDVGKIISDSSVKVGRPTADGNPFILDAATLAVTDQYIAAYLEEIVPLLERYSPQSSLAAVGPSAVTECQPDTGDRFIDEWICRKQRLDQRRPTTSRREQASSANVETKGFLATFSSWVATARAEASIRADKAAKSLQSLWTTTSGYLSNYAALEVRPRLSAALANTGEAIRKKVVDSGIPVMVSTDAAMLAYRRTNCTEPAPFCNTDDTSIVPDDNLGVIVASESHKQQITKNLVTFFKTASDPETPCYLRTAKCVVAENVGIPDGEESIPLAEAVEPPAPMSRYDGTYTGSFGAEVRVAGQVVPIPSTPFSFSVRDGVIEGWGEGGKISQEGRFQLTAAVSGIKCSWGGRIAPSGPNNVGKGGIFCSGSVDGVGFEMSGEWSAER